VAALRAVESGNREQARAEANAALKLAPNRDVRSMAALALARAGDTSGAEKLAAALPHDGNAAAAEFQKFIDHRGVVVNFPWGALARLGLGRAYALCRATRRKPSPRIKISSPSGKTPTPTFRFSSPQKRNTQSCSTLGAPRRS